MPLAFLAVFFVYPVVAIVGRGLAPHWSVDLDPLRDVITDARLRHIAWFTVWQATLSTVLTLAVAIPGAYVLARCEFPGRRLVRALVTVPFVLPTVVVGSAFVALLGDGGPLASLGLDQTLGAILIAHVFFNYSVVVRTVGSLWSHLDPRPEEAARMLGASRLRTFREVTLPALRPAIAAAGAVVFLFTFTSFGVILILGGPGTATLETEIYRQTAEFLNLPLAAALTVVQLVAIVLLLLLTGWIEGRQRVSLSLRAAAETARTTAHRGRACVRGRQPRADGAAPRRADRRARPAFVRHSERTRSRLLPSTRRGARGQHAVRGTGARDRQLAALRGGGHGDRGRRRWLRRLRAGVVAATRARRARVASARSLGGHGRVRLPHRARPRTLRPPGLVVVGAHRAGAGGGAVRGAGDDTGAARHRSAPA